MRFVHTIRLLFFFLLVGFFLHFLSVEKVFADAISESCGVIVVESGINVCQKGNGKKTTNFTSCEFNPSFPSISCCDASFICPVPNPKPECGTFAEGTCTVIAAKKNYPVCANDSTKCCSSPSLCQLIDCTNPSNPGCIPISQCGVGDTSIGCIIDGNKVFSNAASCGTNTYSCCLSSNQCGKQVGCTQSYNPTYSNCSCADAPNNSANASSGQACCGWVNINDSGTHCLASAPTVFHCGDLGFSPDKPTHKCECNGLPGTLGCCGYFANGQCLASAPQALICGQSTSSTVDTCNCASGFNAMPGTSSVRCCGYVSNGSCSATQPSTSDDGGGNDDGDGGNGGGDGDSDQDSGTTPPLNIFEGPSAASFAALNPLKIFESPYADEFTSPAGIINRALLFVFPLAGLILFVMLVWGGFEMITGATNSKSMQAGKQRITAALIGFGILFASFWIIQIVEYIFNLAII